MKEKSACNKLRASVGCKGSSIFKTAGKRISTVLQREFLNEDALSFIWICSKFLREIFKYLILYLLLVSFETVKMWDHVWKKKKKNGRKFESGNLVL